MPASFANGSAVSVESLSYSYGERRALDGVSFEIAPGEHVAILGPNGGGKTTLFRVLTTLASPSSGQASVFGEDVIARRQQVRGQIGVVFQTPALDIKLTVRENLLHHGHLHGISGSALSELITDAMKRLEIADRANDRVEGLSGGLRRRAELAKVTMTKPLLLLLDEPTTGLDPLARASFWQLIDSLRAETGAAVLFTTHLLDEAEDAGRAIILDRGRIVADGPPERLRGEVRGHIVRLKSRQLDMLREQVATAYSVDAEIEGDAIRVTVDNGPDFASRAQRDLGDRIEAVEISRPSLYDVFRQRTGHAFTNGSIS